jgi:hypothetical protein
MQKCPKSRSQDPGSSKTLLYWQRRFGTVLGLSLGQFLLVLSLRIHTQERISYLALLGLLGLWLGLLRLCHQRHTQGQLSLLFVHGMATEGHSTEYKKQGTCGQWSWDWGRKVTFCCLPFYIFKTSTYLKNLMKYKSETSASSFQKRIFIRIEEVNFSLFEDDISFTWKTWM